MADLINNRCKTHYILVFSFQSQVSNFFLYDTPAFLLIRPYSFLSSAHSVVSFLTLLLWTLMKIRNGQSKTGAFVKIIQAF